MATFTSKQRAHLRSLAHHLKPIVHIGKEGVNESTIKATEEALNTRELLKGRVLDAAPADVGSIGRALADAIDQAELVHVIGNVFVLYRPYAKNPEIKLPA